MNSIQSEHKKKLKGRFGERGIIDAVRAFSNNEKVKNTESRLFLGRVRKTVSAELHERVQAIKLMRGSEKYIEEYSKLKEEFKTFAVDKYSVSEWQILSIYFIYNNMYVLGYYCREKSQELILANPRPDYQKILVLLERNMLKEASKEKERFMSGSRKKIFEEEENLISVFINLLEGKEVKGFDDEFSSYLSEKDVLIIGPTVSVNNPAEIPFYNESVCVVRNNVMLSNMPEKIKIGISYYSGAGVQKMINAEGISAYENALDWLVIKKPENVAKEKKGKIHRAPNVTEVLYMGAAHMLPIMAVDMKMHGAKNIYVCGNNLFLSQRTHAADYVIQQTKESLKYAFAIHNLYSQHAILKIMYEQKVFIADEELSKVLEMPTLEYASEMEKIYY